MTNIIKNEFIKLFKRKKILTLSLVLFIFTLAITLLTYQSNSSFAINNDKSIVNELKKQSKDLNNIEKKKELKNRIDLFESNIKLHNKLSNPNFNWKNYLKEENDDLNKKKLNNSNKTDIERINTNIAMNNLLIKNNIKPSTKYSVTNYEFLFRYIAIMESLLLFIIIAFTVSDIISSEYDKGTIQVILLRPVKKLKLIFGKTLASIITIVSTVLAFDLIAFIISGFLFGFANYKTPVFIYPKFTSTNVLNITYNHYIEPIKGTTSYMSSGELLFKSIILQVLFAICCTIFCVLISLLLKNNTRSLSFSISIPIIALLSSSFLYKERLFKYISFIFSFLSNPIDILTNEYAMTTGCTYINYSSSILILIGWSLLFILIMYISKNKLEYK